MQRAGHMPGLFIWIHNMHPSVRIVLLVLLAVTVQFMTLQALLIAGSALVAMALYWHVGLLRKILYRSRWLMMTLLLIYAFATPGEYVRGWDAGIAPTYEGLREGLLQAGRLAVMLTALALLLGTTQRSALMAGIYRLLLPLQSLGVPAGKFTARLWLTLHYAELEQPREKTAFRGLFDMISDAESRSAIDSVRFSLPRFTPLDGVVFLLAASLTGIGCML